MLSVRFRLPAPTVKAMSGNSHQRRKHRRAHPELYWTAEEIEQVKKTAQKYASFFGLNEARVAQSVEAPDLNPVK